MENLAGAEDRSLAAVTAAAAAKEQKKTEAENARRKQQQQQMKNNNIVSRDEERRKAENRKSAGTALQLDERGRYAREPSSANQQQQSSSRQSIQILNNTVSPILADVSLCFKCFLKPVLNRFISSCNAVTRTTAEEEMVPRSPSTS